MTLHRGLYALILIAFFSTTTLADYLYVNDVIDNDRFTGEIESLGEDLYQKTGVKLYLVMKKDLNEIDSVSSYELSLIPELSEPFVLLTFVEMQKKVDILARPHALYEQFNKVQVLSPSATFVGAVANAVMFGRSFDEFKELLNNYGGTILPVLAQKAKGDDINAKYSVAMYNGYLDVADQIAKYHGKKLDVGTGDGSKYFFYLLRIIFYGIILYAIVMMVKNFIVKRRRKNNENI